MFSERLKRVSASPTQQITSDTDNLKRKGIDVIDFGAGEPDFFTPTHIKESGIAAISNNFTRYTQNRGVLELREAICARYEQDYSVKSDPEEIIVTAGGKQALFNVMMAIVDEGDEVISHIPGWPSIFDQIRLAGGRPIFVDTRSENDFKLDAESVVEMFSPRTRAIVINTPCNPTGAVVEAQVMEKISCAARDIDAWVILDLCYERLIYDDHEENIIDVARTLNPDRTVLVGSVSKGFAMTGWRCGWAVGPKDLISACNIIQGHSTSNACSISQNAAIAALTGPQSPVDEMRSEYRKRRDFLLKGLLDESRIKCNSPDGAFYVFPDITELLSQNGIRTSHQFSESLLKQFNVAVTPGEAFDAPGFLRLAYTAPIPRLSEGLDRIMSFISMIDRKRLGDEP